MICTSFLCYCSVELKTLGNYLNKLTVNYYFHQKHYLLLASYTLFKFIFLLTKSKIYDNTFYNPLETENRQKTNQLSRMDGFVPGKQLLYLLYKFSDIV